MARQRPTMWGCAHSYQPIEVSPTEGGKRARCLGCGACGPVRADTEAAMRALRNEARHRDKVVA
jgi:hypothetical protein